MLGDPGGHTGSEDGLVSTGCDTAEGLWGWELGMGSELSLLPSGRLTLGVLGFRLLPLELLS